eukprot:SAG31_NODE_25653_length_457_cov_0.851955_1_plen_122_part_00
MGSTETCVGRDSHPPAPGHGPSHASLPDALATQPGDTDIFINGQPARVYSAGVPPPNSLGSSAHFCCAMSVFSMVQRWPRVRHKKLTAGRVSGTNGRRNLPRDNRAGVEQSQSPDSDLVPC